MAITEFDVDMMIHKFVAEFRDATAPYYGINTIEVNEENWDAFLEMTPLIHQSTVDSLGGQSFHWSVRDYGNRKRVLWIFYYPENISDRQTYEIYQTPEVREFWMTYCRLTESYDWFVQSEVPEGAPKA